MSTIIPKKFPLEKIVSLRAWDKNSDFSGVVHSFSSDTQEEIQHYIRPLVPRRPLTGKDVEAVPYTPEELPHLIAEIEQVRPQVDTGLGFVIFPAWKGLNVYESRVASWLVDNAFGEPRVQDDQGSHLIEIFNVSDQLSMKTGARYHVTREGNSPHTDAPQVLQDPDYLCLRCVSDGWIGGENILVSADSIYNNLLAQAPELISVLGSDFFFHCRGVAMIEGKEYFPAPILDVDEGGVRLRFLDYYIKAGHDLAGKPFTPEQQKAIYYLNSLFEQSDLQFRGRLQAGQQVVFANKRMLHSRTEFVDRHPAQPEYNPGQLEDLSTANRLMDRTWSYKRRF